MENIFTFELPQGSEVRLSIFRKDDNTISIKAEGPSPVKSQMDLVVGPSPVKLSRGNSVALAVDKNMELLATKEDAKVMYKGSNNQDADKESKKLVEVHQYDDEDEDIEYEFSQKESYRYDMMLDSSWGSTVQKSLEDGK
jgi:hypothetical protein